MTKLLTPRIPYDAAETIQSYAARLSFFHTGQGTSRLLEDYEVRPARFAAGHHDEVAKFAAAVGEDISALQAGTVRTYSRYNSFREEDFSRNVLSTHVRQFCPHCLREDGPPAEWRHRLIWCFLPIPDCLRHRSSLVEVTPGDAADIRDAVACVGGLDVAETSTSYAEGGRHLAWLHARLSSSNRPGWLDGQSIEQVLNASEMLGIVLEHGQGARPGRLSRRDRSSALATGFRIYEEGAGAVYGALDEIRRSATATAVHAGPLAMYGALYDWLDRRSQLIAPGPVRDILREHILNHDAYAPGERLLGEPVGKRRLHSVISLAMTLKVNRRRMSRLLQKLGLVPEGATDGESGRLVFPVEEVEQLIKDYETAIPLAQVPDYIGGTQSQTLALYRAGVLPPVIPADAPGAVRRVIFARRVLDDLLSRIGELSPFDDTQREKVLSIGEACQRHGGRTEDLTQAVLAGKIEAFRLPGDTRLHAVRVSVSELAAAGQPGRHVGNRP
ncbi:TniQ family protein [Paracoccus angustae]|uniref:TniQ family protein n=1 Tax=Paracoccus angustae TaxID=1671480 RepID=A0ABV7TYG5_9RHOB